MNNKILLDGHALDEVTIKNSKMKPGDIIVESSEFEASNTGPVITLENIEAFQIVNCKLRALYFENVTVEGEGVFGVNGRVRMIGLERNWNGDNQSEMVFYKL